jgi:hypothetical protein
MRNAEFCLKVFEKEVFMLANNGHTTSLLEVRRFLESERAAPSPWAEPKAAIESLYALLLERRDDALFWSRLHDLVQRLEDHRVNLSRLSHSEAFGYATVQKLLDDLRADLGENGNTALLSWKNDLFSSLRATSLAAFLLLGTASLSCQEDDDSDSEELCPEAVENNIPNDEVSDYCDLVDAINESNLTADEKAGLIECLPTLEAAYREQLLNDFQTMSDTQLANYLHVELYCRCDFFTDSDDNCH